MSKPDSLEVLESGYIDRSIYVSNPISQCERYFLKCYENITSTSHIISIYEKNTKNKISNIHIPDFVKNIWGVDNETGLIKVAFVRYFDTWIWSLNTKKIKKFPISISRYGSGFEFKATFSPDLNYFAFLNRLGVLEIYNLQNSQLVDFQYSQQKWSYIKNLNWQKIEILNIEYEHSYFENINFIENPTSFLSMICSQVRYLEIAKTSDPNYVHPPRLPHEIWEKIATEFCISL
jgi:hypothetical protein